MGKPKFTASSLTLDATPTDCSTLANTYTTTSFSSLYTGMTNPNTLAVTPTLNFNEVTGCAASVPTTGGVAGTNSTNSFHRRQNQSRPFNTTSS